METAQQELKEQQQDNEQHRRTPTGRFRVGAVTAAVWENLRQSQDGGTFPSFSVTLDKAYRDDSGQWKHTGSLHISDLPAAILALQAAYEKLALVCELRTTTPDARAEP